MCKVSASREKCKIKKGKNTHPNPPKGREPDMLFKRNLASYTIHLHRKYCRDAIHRVSRWNMQWYYWRSDELRLYKNLRYAKKRMICERRQTARRKAVFYRLKGHLLQAERWPFVTVLAVSGLRACLLATGRRLAEIVRFTHENFHISGKKSIFACLLHNQNH